MPAAGTALVSAHGRSAGAAVGRALGARRVAMLTSPEHDPGTLLRMLARAGVEGWARVVVAERLGGEERVREGRVAAPPPGPYDPLAVLVVEREAAAGPGVGTRDAACRHEGRMDTMPEVRAVVLAALDIAAEDVVWDLGAGSGTVAIEAGRLAPDGAVYAVEVHPERAAGLARNVARQASWNVEVIDGGAESAAIGMPAPDAVHIGGGGAEVGRMMDVSVAAIRRRRAGVPGRLVASLPSPEAGLEAADACRRLGLDWRLTRVQVSRARPFDGLLGWEEGTPVHVVAARVARS